MPRIRIYRTRTVRLLLITSRATYVRSNTTRTAATLTTPLPPTLTTPLPQRNKMAPRCSNTTRTAAMLTTPPPPTTTSTTTTTRCTRCNTLVSE